MPERSQRRPAALLDLDGTLVDTNYQHAVAWFRAFRAHGIVLPVWRLHRHVGMGGDQLITAVAGEEVEARRGDEIRTAEKRAYQARIEEIELMADAARLVEVLHARGHEVVLASSASQEDLTFYRRKLGVAELIAGATSGEDVQKTKPAPDLILAALEKVSGQDGAVMVGDSTWDCEAARRVGIPSIALLTGGFGEDELRAAGASAVFDSLGALIETIDDTPLG